MSTKFRRILVVAVSLLVVLGVLIAMIPVAIVPYLARQSFPKTDGELHLANLDGAVDIYRDQMGIPHIYASSLHDLFFAQGYIHAQERFWQMDFWRHIGSGRLSEMFGESQVETDAFLRSLGWRQVAEQEFGGYTPESKAIMEAYASGVNAYLLDHQGVNLSLEYAILRLLNPTYSPEPWTPIHSLTWGTAMAWDLRGNIDEEIERSILLKTLTPLQVNDLFPPYPSDHPVIVPEMGDFSGQAQFTSARQARDDLYSFINDLDLASVTQKTKAIDGLLNAFGGGIGSNSWVISGQHTTTGLPILANDPHLGIQMPSIWFQVGLHCLPKTDLCPYEVAGFSFAGVPGVIIGHNDRIAWGFTNNGPDVMDLYIEKINPNNPNQYEVNGQWVDMTLRSETIEVSDAEPVVITIRHTRNGPIISDTYAPLLQTIELEENATEQPKPYQEKAGIELPLPYAISLRWTALEPAYLFEAIWGFNKARNWQEFRQASTKFTIAAQNLLYADVEGNIAYQNPGNIPLRPNGDGTLPVPGWNDDYQWQGYIPFDELPFALNPPGGFIVTANNQSHPIDYSHLISKDWDYGFRAQRILDMITNAPGRKDISSFQSMQGDNTNLNAQVLVPILMQIESVDIDPNRSKLANWDFQNNMDSQTATLFEYFWWFLLKNTFTDEAIPEDYWPIGGSRWIEVVRLLVQQPASPWWDDQFTSDTIETRDDIFIKAFNEAIAAITEQYGKNPDKWPEWGMLHTATFRNATLGDSGIAPIEKLFNRGPYPTSGGESIVNATGWDVFDSFEVTWLPSQRMIVNLSDLNQSLTVHTTGQSGHAYHPHYNDMIELWRNIEYYPMFWEQATIIDNATNHLRLLP